MQQIGTVKFVQIQRYPMKNKVEGRRDRVYNPAPLLTVERLYMTENGISGCQGDRTVIVDVHNVKHPESRYRQGNKISFGLLFHYNEMRERFGEHMDDGIAGENILIEVDDSENLPDIVDKTLIIRNSQGVDLQLTDVIAAPPCREFSVFCAQRELHGVELNNTIEWLLHGRRGYYAELANPNNDYFVSAGDTIYIAD